MRQRPHNFGQGIGREGFKWSARSVAGTRCGIGIHQGISYRIAPSKKTEAKRRNDAERKCLEIERKITRIVNAIAAGTDSPFMHMMLMDLEKRKVEVEEDLAEIDDPRILEIHPNLAEVYRRKILKLEDALHKEGEARQQAMMLLRRLVDLIVLHPGEKRGHMEIEIQGKLAAILQFINGNPAPLQKSMLSLVAEARIRHKHTFARYAISL